MTYILVMEALHSNEKLDRKKLSSNGNNRFAKTCIEQKFVAAKLLLLVFDESSYHLKTISNLGSNLKDVTCEKIVS